MNLSELQTNLQNKSRDLSERFVGSAERIYYLNEALRKINSEYDWSWTETSTAFSYTAGSPIYQLSALASDFKRPLELQYNYQYEFNYLSPEDFFQLSVGSYNIWSNDSEKLYIKTSFGSATLTLKYYSTNTCQTSGSSKTSALANSTDMPLMPERFQDMIIDYAAAMIFQKQSKKDDYAICRNEYEKQLRTMKREYIGRPKIYFSRIRDIREMTNQVYSGISKANPLGT